MADLDVIHVEAFTEDNSADTNPTTAAVATNPTNGNLLLVAVGTYEYQTGTPTMSDSSGLTWTLEDSHAASGEFSSIYIFSAVVSGSPTSMTLSPSWAVSSRWVINYLEIENGDQSTLAFGQSTYTSGNSKTKSYTWTGRSANTRLVSLICASFDFDTDGDQNSGTWGASAESGGVTATRVGLSVAYHTLAAAGSYDAGWGDNQFRARLRITAIEVEAGSAGPVTGTGSLSATAAVTGSGEKQVDDSGSVAATAAVSGAGEKIGEGAGSVAVTVALSGTGRPVASGSGSLSATVAVSGTGEKQVDGSGSVAATSAVTGSGEKQGEGAGSVAVTVALTGTGVDVSGPVQGTGSLSATVALSGAGEKQGEGAGSVAVSVALTGTGQDVVGPVQGTGSLSATVALSGAGEKQVDGTGSVAATVAVTGTGRKVGQGAGSVAVAVSLQGSGAGGPVTGSGVLPVTVAISGSGRKVGQGSGSVTVTISTAGAGEVPPSAGEGTVAVAVAITGTGQKTLATGTGHIDVRARPYGERRQAYLNGNPALVLGVDVAMGEGPLWDVDKWGQESWVDDLAWLTVAPWVASAKTRLSARASINETFRAGAASVRLQNPDGIFTIQQGLVPGQFIDMRPGLRIRVTVTHGVTLRVLFTGYIRSIKETYGRTGTAYIDLQIDDAFPQLASVDLSGFIWGQGNQTHKAIDKVLDAIGVPDSAYWRVVDTTSEHTVERWDPEGATGLDVLRRLADAEGGSLYVDHFGRVIFKSRDWLTDTKGDPPRLTVDSEAAAELDLRDLAPLEKSDKRIINEVTYRRASTDDPADNVYASDLASKGLWGRRSLERFDLLCETNAQVQTLADRAITQRGAIRPELRQFTVRPKTVDQADEAAGTLIGDVVNVDYQTPVMGANWGWDRDGNVVGIEHTIDKAGTWTVTMSTDTTYQEA